MKQFWVDCRPWNKEIATTAIESGADAIVTDKAENVKRLGRITTIAPDGDLKPGTDVAEVAITDKKSENAAAAIRDKKFVIVSTTDWTVIPLENLVAQSDRIIAKVKDEKEADLALTVLERGTAGILLATKDPAVVKAVAKKMKAGTGNVALVPFRVTKITPVGMGDRVCVDTCSMLSDGEGMLMGNTSSAMLLVHAETLENPYVAPRPFRVNAGAVHAYILMPDGKTAYLSDLAIGGSVLVSDAKGKAHSAIIGRTKIERRPLLLVEAESGKDKVSLILQNAETIRLVDENGGAISVVNLKAGDTVMGCVLEGGRHFGMAVKETIREK
ncbi:3-dehydroquinate synthase II [Methanoregula sp. PtaB.Bin085]|uniref:3-dehydroquinate synthase II n=1 Tax=Methanoregula sp. PtaB.Bin085 TaxID=1811680 RepID=UPI0009C59C72|nr:3-dehydroquinate synthase II [Methanoregula sp. PtaB.Bin085]OPX63463.1 MAG: 3-dehydroquinate synthase [Methanoregula sp. PtaB.Bin085]